MVYLAGFFHEIQYPIVLPYVRVLEEKVARGKREEDVFRWNNVLSMTMTV